MRCVSCNCVLYDFEVDRTSFIDLPDGEQMSINEDFCTECLSKYVYGADFLDSTWKVLEDVCDDLYELKERAINGES